MYSFDVNNQKQRAHETDTYHFTGGFCFNIYIRLQQDKAGKKDDQQC
jgi:hypothetical protein